MQQKQRNLNDMIAGGPATPKAHARDTNAMSMQQQPNLAGINGATVSTNYMHNRP